MIQATGSLSDVQGVGGGAGVKRGCLSPPRPAGDNNSARLLVKMVEMPSTFGEISEAPACVHADVRTYFSQIRNQEMNLNTGPVEGSGLSRDRLKTAWERPLPEPEQTGLPERAPAARSSAVISYKPHRETARGSSSGKNKEKRYMTHMGQNIPNIY